MIGGDGKGTDKGGGKKENLPSVKQVLLEGSPNSDLSWWFKGPRKKGEGGRKKEKRGEKSAWTKKNNLPWSQQRFADRN